MKFITKLAVALAVFGALSFAPRALLKPESVYADVPTYNYWEENTNYTVTGDQNEKTMTINAGNYSGGYNTAQSGTSYVVKEGTSFAAEPRQDLAHIIRTNGITKVVCKEGVVFNTDCGGLFANCENLTSVDLSNVDMTNVSSVGNLFNHCTSLTSVQLPIMAPTNVAGMFQDCEKLRSVDLSNLDLREIPSFPTYYENMFTDSYIMFIKAPSRDPNKIVASYTIDNKYYPDTWKVNSDGTYTKYTAKTYKAAANNIGYCFDTHDTNEPSIYAVLKITKSEEDLKNINSIDIKNNSSTVTGGSLYQVYNTIQFPDDSTLSNTENDFKDCYLVAVKINGVEELPEGFGFELK